MWGPHDLFPRWSLGPSRHAGSLSLHHQCRGASGLALPHPQTQKHWTARSLWLQQVRGYKIMFLSSCFKFSANAQTTGVKMTFDLRSSHHIQSTGCWRPACLCRGPRRYVTRAWSCCCRPSGSLSPGRHRTAQFYWEGLGTRPQSDGAAHQFGGVRGAAAPPPAE